MNYEAYQPTKWEERIDRVVRLLAPRMQTQRMVAREAEHRFKYLAAYPTSSRRNSNASSSGETMRGAREKLQVMWNAITAVENSGLCTALMTKIMTYVCGRLRWQARTGDRVINNEYEDYMRLKLTRDIDCTGRFSLRQMAMLDVKGMLVKGDIGCNIVREGSEIYLQGVEADRIGDPFDYKITDNYVRGLVLDDKGVIVGVKVYRRSRYNGLYSHDMTVPMRDQHGLPMFLFLCNPISYDDYRGVSVFKTAIDNATYIDRMREYELQALMWAASQSGIYHTKSGLLPEQLPFDPNPPMDQSGQAINTFTVRPNTVTAVGMGEDVAMFQHDRPSPNVVSMVRETIRDIAVGVGVSFEFAWDKSGLGGPSVRQVSGEDARAIELWQLLLREQKLDQVATLVLGNAIANREVPFHPQWNKWEWFFPSKGTIDVGRESEASINEMEAGINSGARIMSEEGEDIGEILAQRGREVEANIEVAMLIAQKMSLAGQQMEWREVYDLMFPRKKGGQQGGGMPPGGGGFPPMPPQPTMDGRGVTSDGVVLEDGKTNGNGAGKPPFARGRFRADGDPMPVKITTVEEFEKFYREDQARDEGGRFAPEGGGGEPTGGEKQEKAEKGKKEKAPGQFFPWEVPDVKKGREELPAGTGEEELEPVHRVTKSRVDRHQNALKEAEKELAAVTEAGGKEAGYEAHRLQERVEWERAMLKEAKTEHGAQLDKAIADYKPDRSLSDPAKTTSITEAAPGTSYTAYSQTPFFDDVNILQGNKDALEYGVEDYITQRQALFETIPPTKVALDDVVMTQEKVNTDRVTQLVDDPSTGGTKPIQVVRSGGKTYILNGHHRVVAELQRGTMEIDAHVLDLDYPDPPVPTNDAELPDYVRASKATPQVQTVENRLKALGATNGEREGWTKRENTLPDGTYKPEVKALHEKAYAKFLNPKAVPKEGEKPVAVIMIGKPASGKTTAAGGEIKERFGELVNIGCDDVRPFISQYRGWNAAATQDESKDIVTELSNRALADRMNVLYDEVGGKAGKLQAKVDSLAGLGYDVHLVHVDAPTYQTVARAKDRFHDSGRWVDVGYMLDDADDNPKKSYDLVKASPNLASWEDIDNKDFKRIVRERGSRKK